MKIRQLPIAAPFKIAATETHDEIRGIVAAHDRESDLVTYIDIDTSQTGMAVGNVEVIEWIN